MGIQGKDQEKTENALFTAFEHLLRRNLRQFGIIYYRLTKDITIDQRNLGTNYEQFYRTELFYGIGRNVL